MEGFEEEGIETMIPLPEDESVNTIASDADEGSESHRQMSKRRLLLRVVLFALSMIGLFAAMGSVGFGVGVAIGGRVFNNDASASQATSVASENAHTGSSMQLNTGDRTYVGAVDCWEARHLRHLSNAHAELSSRQQPPSGNLRGE
ncbi:hypothetical protein THAOC_23407, partial [Thalassiosira oceanica]